MSKDECMARITRALQRGANRLTSAGKSTGVELTLSCLSGLSGGSNMLRRLSASVSPGSGGKSKRRSSTFSNASASDLE